MCTTSNYIYDIKFRQRLLKELLVSGVIKYPDLISIR